MIRQTLIALLLIALTALASSPSPAFAQETAPELEALMEAGDLDAIVATLDDRHSPFEDQEIRTRLTVHGGSNDGNQLEFTVMTRGDGRNRAIRFHQPADMRGMGIVIKGSDEIYVKLPGASQVRRVGSHSRKQSFQGTDWNFDDMALIRVAPHFTAARLEEDGDHLVLHLQRRPDADIIYDKLELRVDRALFMIDRITYLEDGQPVKVQERSVPKDLAGYMIYTRQIMRDLRAGSRTEGEVLEEKINQGIPDSTFSRRGLVRGL